MKTCSKCGTRKGVAEFRRLSAAHDGLNYRCRSCCKEDRRAWVDKNPNAVSVSMKAYRLRNLEAVRARERERAKANPEKTKAQAKRTYEKHKQKKLAYTREYRLAHPELYREAAMKWAKANPEIKLAANRRRHASKINAIPAWADAQTIGLVYEKAVQFGMEVDHIVPLRSSLVCGLHVWENLQLLDRSINTAKGNRHWPDMPGEERHACA